ncbi:hypothetical protein RDI58_000776 [Solanum bulbocastanum]|uniref:Uncharacterized protein n=1 Tax=Solanum bulbocastanum TaxID=147425 RepID=A0AAN8UCS5_SOLBU
MKGITKNVSASFLTYHTLSSTFQDVSEEKPDGESGIRLSPFGLASYKMQNDEWQNTHTEKDYEKLCDLQNAADSWLTQLSYSHHDFNLFTHILTLSMEVTHYELIHSLRHHSCYFF